jgi:hypothetical protein
VDVGYSMKVIVCILFSAIFFRINGILWSYKVPGVLGNLSSNALSGVECVPWFHGAKRLILERR